MPAPETPMSDNGMIVTIGMTVGHDRCEIVIPVVASDLDGVPYPAEDCGAAVEDAILPLLLNCVTGDTNVNFIQVESMVNGKIPHRRDYAPGAQAGTIAGDTLPSSCAALIGFYEEPNDVSPVGERIRLGKNFIPGLPEEDVTHNILSDDLIAALVILANKLRDGFVHAGGPATTWYRVVAAVRGAGVELLNIGEVIIRDYVVTQRRRMLPR